eukprot:2897614-Rhodomonas_salina.1
MEVIRKRRRAEQAMVVARALHQERVGFLLAGWWEEIVKQRRLTEGCRRLEFRCERRMESAVFHNWFVTVRSKTWLLSRGQILHRRVVGCRLNVRFSAWHCFLQTCQQRLQQKKKLYQLRSKESSAIGKQTLQVWAEEVRKSTHLRRRIKILHTRSTARHLSYYMYCWLQFVGESRAAKRGIAFEIRCRQRRARTIIAAWRENTKLFLSGFRRSRQLSWRI